MSASPESSSDDRTEPVLGVVHHHAFKCAGATVAGILFHNYGDETLFLEHPSPGHRFTTTAVRPYLEQRRYRAVTSHLLSYPAAEHAIAAVHFGLVRDAAARVWSSFHFQRKNERIDLDLAFEDYATKHFQSNDFQSRHASIDGDGKRAWVLDDRSAGLIDAPHVLLGTVEQFDESMCLLERRLAAAGIEFDGSYPGRANAVASAPKSGHRMTDAQRELCYEHNVRDRQLHARATASIEAAMQEPGMAEHLAEYRERCQAFAERQDGKPLRFPAPVEWTYLPDSD